MLEISQIAMPVTLSVAAIVQAGCIKLVKKSSKQYLYNWRQPPVFTYIYIITNIIVTTTYYSYHSNHSSQDSLSIIPCALLSLSGLYFMHLLSALLTTSADKHKQSAHRGIDVESACCKSLVCLAIAQAVLYMAAPVLTSNLLLAAYLLEAAFVRKQNYYPYEFALCLLHAVLNALLALASRPYYPPYLDASLRSVWGAAVLLGLPIAAFVGYYWYLRKHSPDRFRDLNHDLLRRATYLHLLNNAVNLVGAASMEEFVAEYYDQQLFTRLLYELDQDIQEHISNQVIVLTGKEATKILAKDEKRRKKFTKTETDEEEKGNLCPICFEELSELRDGDDLCLMRHCKHFFHLNCLQLWLEKNKSCPVCRKDLINN